MEYVLQWKRKEKLSALINASQLVSQPPAPLPAWNRSRAEHNGLSTEDNRPETSFLLDNFNWNIFDYLIQKGLFAIKGLFLLSKTLILEGEAILFFKQSVI